MELLKPKVIIVLISSPPSVPPVFAPAHILHTVTCCRQVHRLFHLFSRQSLSLRALLFMFICFFASFARPRPPTTVFAGLAVWTDTPSMLRLPLEPQGPASPPVVCGSSIPRCHVKCLPPQAPSPLAGRVPRPGDWYPPSAHKLLPSGSGLLPSASDLWWQRLQVDDCDLWGRGQSLSTHAWLHHTWLV